MLSLLPLSVVSSNDKTVTDVPNYRFQIQSFLDGLREKIMSERVVIKVSAKTTRADEITTKTKKLECIIQLEQLFKNIRTINDAMIFEFNVNKFGFAKNDFKIFKYVQVNKDHINVF
jgi:hypothetical protein